MARINIETTLWGHPGFQELLIKVGSRHAAKGMVVEFWTLAQEHWFPARELVPMEKVQKFGLEPVIAAGLAEVRDGGVYASGSEEAFAWLFQKQEAGMRSAEAKKKNAQRVSTSVDGSQHTSTTLLSSLSSSLSSLNSKEREREESAHALTPSGKPAQASKPVGPEDIAEAKEVWLDTLAHFKAGRTNLMPEEEQLLARSIQRWGKPAVLFAILGKRHEPSDAKYDPGKNLSLTRILNHKEPEKFERLMNIGVQAKHKKAGVA